MIDIEARKAHYAHVQREADSLGRVIGVRRLKLSQHLKIEEMTPALDGVNESVGDDGVKTSVPRRALPIIAASVCEIDDVHYAFPRNRSELDAVLDALDIDGLKAASAAFAKLNPNADDDESVADKAKK